MYAHMLVNMSFLITPLCGFKIKKVQRNYYPVFESREYLNTYWLTRMICMSAELFRKINRTIPFNLKSHPKGAMLYFLFVSDFLIGIKLEGNWDCIGYLSCVDSFNDKKILLKLSRNFFFSFRSHDSLFICFLSKVGLKTRTWTNKVINLRVVGRNGVAGI